MHKQFTNSFFYVSLLCLLVYIFAINVSLVIANESIANKSKYTRLEDSCKNTTNDLCLNIDSSVDPCNDFSKYTCGGFEKHNVIKEGDGEITQFGKARNILTQRVINLLKEDVHWNEKFETDGKVRDFYAGCVFFENQRTKERKYRIYRHPFRETLKKIGIGGWPYSQQSWKDGDVNEY